MMKRLRLTPRQLKHVLPSLFAISALGLTGCMPKPNDTVDCTGVATVNNLPLYTDKGTCKKLAGGKAEPVVCDHWIDQGTQYVCHNPPLVVPHYSPNSYVKCYGIAAASMNDCGTATTACGGSVHVARQADAWIAIPDGICKRLQGSRIGIPGKDNDQPGDTA